MHFKTADVSGLRIFYREAGDASKPIIVLLHGFPSSSHEFHDLIPLLADRFHVIAPDFPGMGYSDAPDPAVLRPTFDDVARVIDAFIAQHAPRPVILYLYDIGGVIGHRDSPPRADRRPDFSKRDRYARGLEPQDRRDRQPKTLVLWGRNDPLFTAAAPEALKQILPAARVHYFAGGHFPLDEYADPMAEAIIETFSDKSAA